MTALKNDESESNVVSCLGDKRHQRMDSPKSAGANNVFVAVEGVQVIEAGTAGAMDVAVAL
jgi:hypothetical protein